MQVTLMLNANQLTKRIIVRVYRRFRRSAYDEKKHYDASLYFKILPIHNMLKRPAKSCFRL